MYQFKDRNNSIVQYSGVDIQPYMMQVYGWMTVGLLLTAFVSWYAINNSTITLYLIENTRVLFCLIIAELALVTGLSFLLPRLSARLATAMFMFYSVLTGLTISLLLFSYTGVFVGSTFFVTASMFGALGFYGYTTKRSLSSMSSFLFMMLIGVIVSSLVNIYLQNSGLTLLTNYIGVLVFSGLTAYDVQKLKNMVSQIDNLDYESTRKNAIFGALMLYLDFINLFLAVLKILGNNRR